MEDLKDVSFDGKFWNSIVPRKSTTSLSSISGFASDQSSSLSTSFSSLSLPHQSSLSQQSPTLFFKEDLISSIESSTVSSSSIIHQPSLSQCSLSSTLLVEEEIAFPSKFCIPSSSSTQIISDSSSSIVKLQIQILQLQEQLDHQHQQLLSFCKQLIHIPQTSTQKNLILKSIICHFPTLTHTALGISRPTFYRAMKFTSALAKSRSRKKKLSTVTTRLHDYINEKTLCEVRTKLQITNDDR